VNLVKAGFYDGLTFHRLVPGFVIQGGDPSGDGSGGPGYTIPDEPVVGRYGRGIVAMARTKLPNTQGSQFFIVLDDSAEADLASANTYAIFGRVLEGMDVVDAIAAMPTQNGDEAVTPVKILSATVEQVTLPPEPTPVVPGDPELEAMFPTEVNGEVFAAQSNNGTELRAQIPAGDALGGQLEAALALLGKTLEDMSLGGGSVGDQTAGVSITGLRVQGAAAADVQANILPLLLQFADLQETTQAFGDRTVSVLTDGPDSPTANRYYVVDSGDTVFVVQGTEPYITDAIGKLP
jgi:cyclophilin family peptidyl-prolyl cis-trans isomerase